MVPAARQGRCPAAVRRSRRAGDAEPKRRTAGHVARGWRGWRGSGGQRSGEWHPRGRGTWCLGVPTAGRADQRVRSGDRRARSRSFAPRGDEPCRAGRSGNRIQRHGADRRLPAAVRALARIEAAAAEAPEVVLRQPARSAVDSELRGPLHSHRLLSSMIEAGKRIAGPRTTVRMRCLLHGYGLPRWGNLRRTAPFSSTFGVERGTPVDRHYLHRFLDAHRELITGSVLEVQVSSYTTRFGHD